MTKTRKKLIEVALPLEAINTAAAREKSIRHGHPSTLHLWWARRPLAAARAVIFAQMVDDPSSWPDLFPTAKKQDKERQRLFKIIDDLVQWENTTNEEVLERARNAIWESWRRACAENADHPLANEIFNRTVLPGFHDPFAGGGALPLEAQRLGLETYASDLNPVPILINKAMIEIPPKFAGQAPVNPGVKQQYKITEETWVGIKGLIEDVAYYGGWMRDEAEKRIGSLYPKIEITDEMIGERPELSQYAGQHLTAVAWIWARTVKSPNPAFSNVEVPLASTFFLSTKPGKEAYIQPIIKDNSYYFVVRNGKPKDLEACKAGTSAGKRAGFKCLMSSIPIPYEHIRAEGKAGRMGSRLMAVIAEGNRGRVYLSPSKEIEAFALSANPSWKPDCEIPKKHRNFQGPAYGIENLGEIFTNRQLVALTTFSDLISEAVDKIKSDAQKRGLTNDDKPLRQGGNGALAYGEAVGVYLGLTLGRCANYWSSLTPWGGDFIVQTFGRQALPMVWDHAEGNPFSDSTGNWNGALTWVQSVMGRSLSGFNKGFVSQADAQTQTITKNKVVSTDPPYYDNICYADLSDFFYVWHRRAMRKIYPELFATLSVPKAEELVATPNRHGSKEKAEVFFLDGMTQAMNQLAELAHSAFPVTIYYAFKQSESSSGGGTINTGWDTFLEAVIRAGFAITGTWPMRTERDFGMKTGSNVLASSIILVCRTRHATALSATRREFINALKDSLPESLSQLQAGNIAPVDLAQAAIGPGMAVFTRFKQVLDADGKAMTVRSALALINQVLDETLAEQEGDFDADTRWALSWFEQMGFDEGEFGVAEQLSKAKNTAVSGLVESGIIQAGRGKVKLLRPSELAGAWDPQADQRLTTWESVHRLIQAQAVSGEAGAAEIVSSLGSKSETARELCYRLYTLCERKKRAADAMPYNALVQSWPEIVRLAQQNAQSASSAGDLFSQE
jgi:putative DNA methylase